MATDLTINDLLPPVALDDVRALVLSFFAVPQNPITDWYSGAVQRTMMELEAAVITDLVGGALPGLALNGYPDSASGDSLTTLAHGWFETDRDPATFATQTVTLICDATHGPYTIAVDRFLAKSTDGAVYSAITGGTLSTGSSLTIDMGAQSPGAARGLIASLITALPGVSVQAAAIKIISGVTQFGSDGDDDATVLANIDDRFPDLDTLPTQDRLITWTQQASNDPTRFRLDPDTVNAGGVMLTLADPGGGVAGGVVTAVQTAIDQHLAITDLVTVQAAANVTVNAGNGSAGTGGTVIVASARLAAVQAAANAAWVAYLASAQIGANVFLLQLEKAVMDAGALNFTGANLNGVAADFAMGTTQVPVPGGSLATQLTWVTV
jgi:Baseplate J-like protein